MTDHRVATDAALRRSLSERAESEDIARMFESRYGRGWQRKLSDVLGVSESTVHGWVKSGRVPHLAQIAFGALLAGSTAREAGWSVVEDGGWYKVCEQGTPVSRVVASGISPLSDALLLAAAPALFEACMTAQNALREQGTDGAAAIAEGLERALDVARSGGLGALIDVSLEIELEG